jgi:integrase
MAPGSPMAVIAWERYMRETEHAAASTIRRRLAALSSLYKRLVRHGYAARNPVIDVERPALNRDEGPTFAFSKAQARKVLDAPPEHTDAAVLEEEAKPLPVAKRIADRLGEGGFGRDAGEFLLQTRLHGLDHRPAEPGRRQPL